MAELFAAGGIIYFIFAVLLLIAPLMIWSKCGQLVQLQKEANVNQKEATLYLKLLVREQYPNVKLPGDLGNG
jgi:hypothetical protein